jgi:hypothetical protein
MKCGVGNRPLFAGAVVILAVSLCSPAVQGGLVYTLDAEGSGRLGDSWFQSERITISLAAEPGSVTRVEEDFVDVAGIVNVVGPAFVTVAGVGSAQFVNTQRVFATDFGDFGAVGFSRLGGNEVQSGDILNVVGPELAAYRLTVPYGPFTADEASFQDFSNLETTAGPLDVTITGPVTFRASGTPTAVPLPAAAWAGLGTLGILAASQAWRRRRLLQGR